MGASFRNKGEIIALAGCDLLTIAPKLLAELAASEETFNAKLTLEIAAADPVQKITLDEKTFRLMFNEDAMATEKTAQGIRGFAADIVKLEKLVNESL